ncbi:hypothetical protein GTY41_19865 [Streptomyces sp. SID685]|uniref:hypothetical protein n=1 Tax=Streptomyces TaxID=1883 RepID=UPI00136F0E2E|nr:hypothetical protein [Streptomyces sp. SID685]MYR87139.1 hypothetical protein [Streptomyces sp. SID685]
MSTGDERYDGGGDGLDALMAAITGEPLPEEARRDPAFLAEHRAAQADLAALRAGLERLATALDPPPAPRCSEGARGTARPATDGPHPSTIHAPQAMRRGGGGDSPSAPARPVPTAHPVRLARIALGSLGVAAALYLVAGIGWLGAHPGGGVSADGAGQGGKAARPGEKAGGQDGRGPGCAVTVVEGTVTEVEPQGTGHRVTVAVVRSYEPARGPAEVGFLLGGDARPAPHRGQHVLVEIGRGGREASRWTVGDTAVAAERARIEAACADPGR